MKERQVAKLVADGGLQKSKAEEAFEPAHIP